MALEGWSRKSHTLYIENVLYFPQSPVNILSITGLADQLKDKDGTGIHTKSNKYWFYWDKNKFQRTINHPSSNLLELPINEGFLMDSMFSKPVETKVCTTKRFFHCHASTLLTEDNGLKSQAKLSADMFHVGETLLYSNAVHTTYGNVEEIFLDNIAVLWFRARTKSEELIEATKEYLRAPDYPDIGWIPNNNSRENGCGFQPFRRLFRQGHQSSNSLSFTREILGSSWTVLELTIYSDVSTCEDGISTHQISEAHE